MNLLGILSGALSAAKSIYSLVSGNPKPTFLEILPNAIGPIMSGVMSAVDYNKLDSKQKIDSWIEQLDSTLGAEASALDLLKSMPPEVEEELTDALLKCIKLAAYNKAKIPGYYQTPA